MNHQRKYFLLISRKKSGFSIIELLLVVVIISMIGAVSIPVYQSFQTKHSLDFAVSTLNRAARRAQLLAHAVQGDNSWGVKINSGSIVIFQGTSYSSRVAGEDEITDISPAIVFSGTTEYVFSKNDGLPSASGSTTLTDLTGTSQTISVNAKGMVSTQ